MKGKKIYVSYPYSLDSEELQSILPRRILNRRKIDNSEKDGNKDTKSSR